MRLKRIIDITIATVLLAIFSPIFLIIWLLIILTSKGPAIYKQERIGLHGRKFIIYKFRTMKEGAEKETAGKYITGNEEVLTPVGKFLRRWALDELPQLFNVIKGDMSIVGPRPALPYQVERYNERQRKRLEMKPGLTGWAQVNGRNKLTWPERIEYDVWYVENWSLWLDFKIMLMTIPALLRKDFAFAQEDIDLDHIIRCRTMKVIFMGKNKKSSVVAFKKLLDMNIDVSLAVAQKDTNEISKHSLWDECVKKGINVITSEELEEMIENGDINSYKDIDLIISFLYWKRIRNPLLYLARLGCINFHPAPLPEFRGLGGYNIAILENLDYWGVSVHFVDENIDTGDIIKVRKFKIDPTKETAMSLERKSQAHLLELFLEVVPLFKEGKNIPRVPQDYGRYFTKDYYESLKKVDLEKDDAETIERKVRAFWFPPYDGAYVEVGEKRFTLVSKDIMKELERLYEFDLERKSLE